MTTIFSDVPYDLIRYIGNYLDYDSTINFNRILDPTERIVHRRFSKQELFEHEVVSQRQTLLIASSRINEYSSRTIRGLRKRCRCIVDMMSIMRLHKRGSIVWKTYPKFYDAVMRKCNEILEPESNFLCDATSNYKKSIKKEAILLKADLEGNISTTNPRRIYKTITIND